MWVLLKAQRPEVSEHEHTRGSVPVPLSEGRHPRASASEAGSSRRGSTPHRASLSSLYWYGFSIASMLWSGSVATNVHPFQLRVPLDLWESLERAATTNERSMQREITFRLRRSFTGEVASAETRERAGATGLSPAEEQTPIAAHDRSFAELVDPVASLPDREVRHEQCLKRTQHHIYHGGRPCPLCGYPA